MLEDVYPVRWSGQQAIVTLPAHIDLSNAGMIREELLSVINRGAQALIADMSGTVSCDHAGAEALSRAYQRSVASGTEMRLVLRDEIVRRALSMGGIDRLVSIYPSLDASMAAGAPAAGAALTMAEHSAETGSPGAAAAGARAGAPQRGRGGVAGLVQPDPDVGVEVALLDRDGVIVSVNQAWQAFALVNGGDPARVGRGVSYLDACATAGADPVAQQVAAAIRRALAGDMPGPLTVEVPCHSPDTARWFDMLISARRDDDGRPLGATVTLSLARSGSRTAPASAGRGRTARPGRRAPSSGKTSKSRKAPNGTTMSSGTTGRPGRARTQFPAAASAGWEVPAVTPSVAWKLLDALNDGVALADSDGTVALANRRLAEMFGYGHDELHGCRIESLLPADLQEAGGSGTACGREPQAVTSGGGARLVARRKNGTTFPAEVTFSPVSTETGHFAFTVIRDASQPQRTGQVPGPVRAVAPGGRADRGNELLDRVVTSLFRVGLSLEEAIGLPPEAARAHIAGALGQLDETIRVIRNAAFAERDPAADRGHAGERHGTAFRSAPRNGAG